jgi:hypothetical protein
MERRLSSMGNSRVMVDIPLSKATHLSSKVTLHKANNSTGPHHSNMGNSSDLHKAIHPSKEEDRVATARLLLPGTSLPRKSLILWAWLYIVFMTGFVMLDLVLGKVSQSVYRVWLSRQCFL